MKKVIAVLCVLVVAAVVALGVTISGKNDLQAKLDAANTQVTDLTAQVKAAQDDAAQVKADAEAAAAKAAEDLAAVQNQAEEAAAKAAEDLAAAKAEAEEAVKNVDVLTALKNQAEEAAAQAAADFDAFKAQAEETAAKAAEDLAAAKATIEEQAAALTAALANALGVEEEAPAEPAVAYIMYANADWSQQYWNDGSETAVIAANAEVTGEGAYTVSLDFTATEAGEADGLAFAALGIKNGEAAFPGAFIKINAIRVNGEAIEVKKGYTASDDGVETRMNVYNEWVSELPADARSFDGSIDGASPIIVDKEAFAAVKTVEIDFELVPVSDEAYIMFASADWSQQYWNDGSETAVVAVNPVIKGEGTYTASLDFSATEAGSASGLAFAALGVKTGEQTFPGWFIDVKEVLVNGEAIELGKGYTTSDNGVETRENLFNEWVSELPADARRKDNDLEGASAIIVNKDLFENVVTVSVTFDFIYGEAPVKAADAPLTEDEINAYKTGAYNAYTGIQTEKYTFRNEWNEANYGRDSEANPGFFKRLTGWDADGNAVDFGGVFEDAVIDHNGEYTVSMTTGDMGFAEDDTKLRLLFVSTEIPSRAITDGILTISDVKVKIGDGRTQEYTNVNTEGAYARITLLDEYNLTEEPVAYTMPIGPNTPIVVTFTVSGMAQ